MVEIVNLTISLPSKTNGGGDEIDKLLWKLAYARLNQEIDDVGFLDSNSHPLFR